MGWKQEDPLRACEPVEPDGNAEQRERRGAAGE